MLRECQEPELLVRDPRSKAVNVFAEPGCVKIIVCVAVEPMWSILWAVMC